jgi:23S rRNA (cytosine1962-C5)-methyltransferase
MSIQTLLSAAIEKRQVFLQQCSTEKTDCYRLFHGTAESEEFNGLNIDRYGDAWLIQSFQTTLDAQTLDAITSKLAELADYPIIYNDRSNKNSRVLNGLDELTPEIKAFAQNDQVISELGIQYTSKLRHEGQDPLLFLDMRSGRRFVKANSQGKSVLNLFSYTCGIGIAAAVGGAKQVMNVDFSSFALAAGRKNAELNNVEANSEFIQSDAFPALRQLAGLKVSVRRGKKLPDYPKLAEQQFDLVFLDPPRFAKSAFGTVDLVNDYQSLFKPAMLATAEGGTIIACNNVAKVDREAWYKSLVRCVEKQGREVMNTQWLDIDEDFPSFDNNHPLKMVALTIE